MEENDYKNTITKLTVKNIKLEEGINKLILDIIKLKQDNKLYEEAFVEYMPQLEKMVHWMIPVHLVLLFEE